MEVAQELSERRVSGGRNDGIRAYEEGEKGGEEEGKARVRSEAVTSYFLFLSSLSDPRSLTEGMKYSTAACAL